MNRLIYIFIITITVGIWSSCQSPEKKEEFRMARRIGNMHAHEVDSLLLAGDTLGTQDLLIQIASTEAEIRRRGSSSVANSYLESFLNTLDSLQSQLASELSRTSLSN